MTFPLRVVTLLLATPSGCTGADGETPGPGDRTDTARVEAPDSAATDAFDPPIRPPRPTVHDLDGDGWTPAEGDCDDQDAGRHPGAVEECDEVDNDCNSYVDEAGDCHRHPVRGFSETIFTVKGGDLVDVEKGFRWVNEDGDDVCTLSAGYVESYPVPATCSECVWAFALNPEAWSLSGEKCDVIPFSFDPWEVIDWYADLDDWTYWGFAPSAEIDTFMADRVVAANVIFLVDPLLGPDWFVSYYNYPPLYEVIWQTPVVHSYFESWYSPYYYFDR